MTATGDIKFLITEVPSVPKSHAAKAAREIFGLEGKLKPLVSDRDTNFHLATEQGDFILKFFHPDEDPGVIDFQTQGLLHIQKQAPDLPVPHVRRTLTGEAMGHYTAPDGRTSIVRLLTWLPGKIMGQVPATPDLLFDLGGTVARLDLSLRGFFHPSARHTLLWDLRQIPALRRHARDIEDKAARRNVEKACDHFIRNVLPRWDTMRSQVIHNDANLGNVVVAADNPEKIAGIIDFGDMIHAPVVCEVAMAADGFTVGAKNPMAMIAEVARGYDAVSPLEDDEIDTLHDHVAARLAMTVIIIARRKVARQESPDYLPEQQQPYTDALDRMMTIGSTSGRDRLRKELRFPVYCAMGDRDTSEAKDLKALMKRRHTVLSKRLSLFYNKPIHMERGRGAILYDANGRAFVDAYNNVPSVGHCHPHVAHAVARQAHALATNTRYVYSIILDYAEKLVATMPGDLKTCIFVNSGSEANDIAWRMSTMLTGNYGGIIMEHAYHGITEAIAALSPEGDDALEANVRTLVSPDTYRGEWGAGVKGVAAKYAADADRAIAELEEADFGTACFMIDTSFCSNGIPDVPKGYLKAVEKKVHKAGGLSIADEVQYGFGRPGTHMWGFAYHGMTPDIVTIGKPAGDGFPLGVVVTTPEIMEEFSRRSGLFSTFGGNPVACAAGIAVLDVIERENLVENGRTTGEYMRAGLRKLMKKHSLIGDVRGHGMIAGVEIVKDRKTKEPAPEEMSRIQNRMRELGVLTGSEGHYHNVFKIRPPMVFKPEHADILVEAMDQALSEM